MYSSLENVRDFNRVPRVLIQIFCEADTSEFHNRGETERVDLSGVGIVL